jgi:hypothetical protein
VGAFASPLPSRFPTQRTEVRFVRPTGMKVSWYSSGGAKPGFTSTQIDTPGRYNFAQAAIYRLKLSNIEGRPGMVVYPTLEVVPSNAKTDAFLAHSAVPVEFTNEDLDQVAAGNYVVKVIYLPDPQYQDVASTGGLEEIVSSRLEPGTDPIVEAQRRGSILLVIRMGNILLELENTPPMDAPNPYACPPGLGLKGPGMGPGGPSAPPMVPYYGMGGMGGLPMGPGGPMMGGLPMGPGGPMAGPGGMPPGGPMMGGLPMGPGGPMMGGLPPMGPGGPMLPTSPGMAPNPLLGQQGGASLGSPMIPPPPGPAAKPAAPTGPGTSQPAKPGVPVTQLPDTSDVKQAQYTGSASGK